MAERVGRKMGVSLWEKKSLKSLHPADGCCFILFFVQGNWFWMEVEKTLVYQK